MLSAVFGLLAAKIPRPRGAPFAAPASGSFYAPFAARGGMDFLPFCRARRGDLQGRVANAAWAWYNMNKPRAPAAERGRTERESAACRGGNKK